MFNGWAKEWGCYRVEWQGPDPGCSHVKWLGRKPECECVEWLGLQGSVTIWNGWAQHLVSLCGVHWPSGDPPYLTVRASVRNAVIRETW